MKRLTLALSIFACFPLHAQINVQWESRYNGTGLNTPEIVSDMFVDPSGNIYVTGSSYAAASGYDIVTVKYDNAGTQLWVSTFNGSGNGIDESKALAVDASGNVYVCGYSFRGGSNFDYTTIKYNSAGVQQWQQYYDAGASLFDEANDLAVDASGNVYVTGAARTSSTNTNIRTLKYNSTGVQQWMADFTSSGSNLDQGKLIVLDAAGSPYVAGNAFNTGQDLNYRILKYNPATGAQVWTVQYNHTLNSYDYPTDMALDASGNLFVTGYSYNGAASDDDVHTIKINTSGTIVNTVIFNGTANSADISNAIQIDASGNVYVAGRAKNTGTSEDFWVAKYNNALAQQWSDSYNGSGANYDEATDIAIDLTGNVYVTGYSYLTATNNDFLTIKYDPASGSRLWSTRFNGTANNSDQAKAINVDAAGNVYVSGDSKGSGTGTDYSTIKYCQLTTNAGTDEQICSGDDVQLNATGGTSWLWTPSAGLSSVSIPNPVAAPSSTTTYIVSSTDGNGCTDYDTIEVVVNPLPGPVITPDGPTTFCVGDSVQLSASGFSSYSWNTGSSNSDITVYSAGTYTVTVTDAMMCNNFTSISVSVNALPNVDAGTASAFCYGDSTQLQASGAVNYLWDSNPELSAVNIADPYASPLADTWFYVHGIDANGCMNYDSVEVVVNPLPATPTNTFIQANYTLVTNNTTGNQWYLNGVPVSGGTSQVLSITANGQYWVVYTDANNCMSQNSDTVTILDVSVEETGLQNMFSLYPNPNDGMMKLSIEQSQGGMLQIEMLNLVGEQVYSCQEYVSGHFEKTFDFTSLSKGIYLFRLSNGDKVQTQKVVIR